jgi:membrane-associated phospholipid phosphatase
MYNNQHWFSDIMAGAGIGMASTTLSYWLYDKIPSPFHKKASSMVLFPTCSPDAFEITVVQNF